jgi:hypothetical protein
VAKLEKKVYRNNPCTFETLQIEISYVIPEIVGGELSVCVTEFVTSMWNVPECW